MLNLIGQIVWNTGAVVSQLVGAILVRVFGKEELAFVLAIASLIAVAFVFMVAAGL